MEISGSRSRTFNPFSGLSKLRAQPTLVVGVIILAALVAFEIFNYSTTDYALNDLLGDLRFAGVRWATILALAFCGIDFAGIARLFTPQQGSEEPREVWYLFGAWLLAATMNAILTWWGVSMAIATHSVASTAVLSSTTITKVVPVFVSIMVWVIRILIIGSLSVAGDRILWGRRPAGSASQMRSSYPVRPATASSLHSTPRASMSGSPHANTASHPEPTYHSTLGYRPIPPASLEKESNAASRRM